MNDNAVARSQQQRREGLFERLRNNGIDLNSDQMRRIAEKFDQITSYVPKVGVFGKTGAGKSSLCNAIFGKDVAEISDIAACTREPQQILLSLSHENGSGLILVDVPGVGESQARDVEYKALYEKLLPELDIVLWVLKADDRAFSVDEEFYKNVVNPKSEASCPVIFVLNQVDKIEPWREWDERRHCPGPKQLANIKKKAEIVSSIFGVKHEQVCPVSAAEGFGLVGLVERVVTIVPNEKKYSFVREAKEETVSEESSKKAEQGTFDAIKEWLKDFYEQHKETIHKLVSIAFDWLRKKI